MTQNDLELLRMTRNNLKYDKKVKCDGPTDQQTNRPTKRVVDSRARD